MSYGSKRHWRGILPLVLLVMVFMRLVWMQLRSYPHLFETRAALSLEIVSYLALGRSANCQMMSAQGPPSEADQAVSSARHAAASVFASPGYALMAAAMCARDQLSSRDMITLNQSILATTVLVATLMARFITSSWNVALIVAAMLMSRGRLLTDIGLISVDHPMMLGMTTWLMILAHFLRTGAQSSLIIGLVMALAMVVFDPVAVCLPFAATILLFCGFTYRRQLASQFQIQKQRQPHAVASRNSVWYPDEPVGVFGRSVGALRQMLGMELVDNWQVAGSESVVKLGDRLRPNDERGGLLRPLNLPFALWVFTGRRWFPLALTWLTVSVLAIVISCVSVSVLLSLTNVSRPDFLEQSLSWRELVDAFALWRHAWWPSAGEAWQQRLDFHLGVSIIIVIFSAWQAPGAGLASFFELTWLTIVATCLLIFFAAAADFCDVLTLRRMLGAGIVGAPLAALSPRPILAWVEPVWLTLGAAGVYNLMKVFDRH